MSEVTATVGANLTRLEKLQRRESQFWARVQKGDGCWFWQGPTNAKGYGLVSAGGTTTAHRAAWMLRNNQMVPEGKCVLHKCDRPQCVRPDHLWIGTVADNNRDMAAKGRSTFGSKSVRAKLTNRQARRIREMVRSGLKVVDVAKKLGLRYGMVRDIANGSSWSRVTEPSGRRPRAPRETSGWAVVRPSGAVVRAYAVKLAAIDAARQSPRDRVYRCRIVPVPGEEGNGNG